MNMVENEDISLGDRVFRVLEASNQGFFPAHAKVKEGVVHVYYEMMGEEVKFFSLDSAHKKLYFHDSPRAYKLERECISLAKDLQKKDYKLEGLLGFIESPVFKKNEVSLY